MKVRLAFFIKFIWFVDTKNGHFCIMVWLFPRYLTSSGSYVA